MSDSALKRRVWLLWLLLIVSFILPACRNQEGEGETEGTPTPAATEAETSTAGDERAAPADSAEAEEEAIASPTSRPTPTRRPTTPSSDNPQVRVVYSSIHVREGAGVDFAHMSYLYEDEVIQVLDVNGAGTWYEVQLEDGRAGWVATSVVEPVADNPLFASVVSPIEIVGQMEVTPSSVNLRMGPGTKYWIMRRLYEGDVVDVLGRTADHTWFYVQAEGGYLGWLARSVVVYDDELEPNIPVVELAPETLP